MSRNKGLLSISANWEPQAASPFDAREVVQFKSDLINIDTFKANDGNVYIYKGIRVSVTEETDPSSNGIYWLKELPYTDINNWEKVGTGEGVEYENLSLVGSLSKLDGVVINSSGGGSLFVEQAISNEVPSGFFYKGSVDGVGTLTYKCPIYSDGTDTLNVRALFRISNRQERSNCTMSVYVEAFDGSKVLDLFKETTLETGNKSIDVNIDNNSRTNKMYFVIELTSTNPQAQLTGDLYSLTAKEVKSKQTIVVDNTSVSQVENGAIIKIKDDIILNKIQLVSDTWTTIKSWDNLHLPSFSSIEQYGIAKITFSIGAGQPDSRVGGESGSLTYSTRVRPTPNTFNFTLVDGYVTGSLYEFRFQPVYDSITGILSNLDLQIKMVNLYLANAHFYGLVEFSWIQALCYFDR
jgi:hypothetical protein